MPSSPVPGPVAEELRRLGVRWQQLALPEATSRLPAVHAVVEEIAGEPVPDLGPAVVIDQLTVVVYDACLAAATPAADVSGSPVTDPPIGRSGTPPGPAPVTDPPIGRSGTPEGDRSAEPGDTAYLLERLTTLRRTL